MKVADIHKTFKLVLDKNADAVAFGGCPAFLPQEIDSFLNQAYLQVVCNKFTGSLTQVPFEASVKRTADLQKLIKTDKAINLSTSINTNELTLNNFYGNQYKEDGTFLNSKKRMFYVNSVLNFTDEYGSEIQAACLLINHDDANNFKRTYNNDPWIEQPVITIEDNTLKVYIDNYSMYAPYSLDLTYLKEPDKIDHTIPSLEIDEVSDAVMYEVIERAAILALENIESQRTATKAQISNLQE